MSAYERNTTDSQTTRPVVGSMEPDRRLLSVLFVCHGNICRSPMAEFVMKDRLSKAGLAHLVDVESAATSTEEIGNDMHPGAKQSLDRHGVAHYGRRARRITAKDYDEFDLIVGMDEQNLANLMRFYKNDPEHKVSLLLSWAGEGRGIADPWYTGDFDVTYEDVALGCDALAEHIVGLFAKAHERAVKRKEAALAARSQG